MMVPPFHRRPSIAYMLTARAVGLRPTAACPIGAREQRQGCRVYYVTKQPRMTLCRCTAPHTSDGKYHTPAWRAHHACVVHAAVTYPMPSQLDIDDEYVTQHYLWSMFNTISAMIMLTYGVSASWQTVLV